MMPGNTVDGRDVEQAYLQAKMKGPKTHIQLPKEMWTPEMHRMKCPVVLLEKVLYGHKNSGAYWQEICDRQCPSAGFRPLSENWPCVYWNDELDLMLIVYVDDMKMAGPAKNMEQAWEALGKGIDLFKPKADSDGVHNFLGCEHRLSSGVIGDRMVAKMEWDASHSLKRCIARYEEAVVAKLGKRPNMYPAPTPLLHDETKFMDARRPATNGDFFECPTCLDAHDKGNMIANPSHRAGTKRPIKKILVQLENHIKPSVPPKQNILLDGGDANAF